MSAATIALQRQAAGRHAKSQMLLGLRGVGKTVLLGSIEEVAEGEGYLTAMIEAPENRRLAELLVPKLRQILFRLSGVEKARMLATRALGQLRAFASIFKVSYGEIEVGVEASPELAATGDLETDLPELLLAIGRAAAAAERPVAIFIDEVQYLNELDLAALIVALHRVSQKALPVIVIGAGLPQLAGLAGAAKSYAERLFDYPGVGALPPSASQAAVREPLRDAGADIEDDALQIITERTDGYPYFLQEWGYHSWNAAPTTPITVADVEVATSRAIRALDSSFFRVRLDRLTPREQDYIRAMAELGPGPHRSGDVAISLGISVTTAGPLRTALIRKGMIWSPSHGETAFTVPMFDEFMRRMMPKWVRPERR